MKPKEKKEPKLVDMNYIDRELRRLFNSTQWGTAGEMLVKYRSRFNRQQYNKNNPDAPLKGKNCLSLGKKLEILCMYGDYKLVKANKKSERRQNDDNKSDELAEKLFSKVFDKGKEKLY